MLSRSWVWAVATGALGVSVSKLAASTVSGMTLRSFLSAVLDLSAKKAVCDSLERCCEVVSTDNVRNRGVGASGGSVVVKSDPPRARRALRSRRGAEEKS